MIKELEKEFIGKGETKGFKFNQLLKGKRAYIYSVNINGKIHYETFKRVIHKQFNNVSYPSSKQFGYTAFTYPTYELALEKFNKIEYKNNRKT